MSRNRYAAKVDDNQAEIVKKLRAIPGVEVALNHDDIFVGFRGRNYWYEVKNPERALSKTTGKVLESQLKPSQVKLRKTWTGHYRVVTSFEEIMEDLT